MERNIKVARAHRAIGVLYICVVTLLVAAMALTPDVKVTSLIFPIIVFGVVIAAPLVTARGARQSKPWARTASIVISVLLLLGFPVGTLIGIYLLANTWKPWSQPAARAVVA